MAVEATGVVLGNHRTITRGESGMRQMQQKDCHVCISFKLMFIQNAGLSRLVMWRGRPNGSNDKNLDDSQKKCIF